MSLINEMVVDSNGGVYIKEYYSYYTYIKTINNNDCTGTTYYADGYYNSGLYVFLYKNANPNYSADIDDKSTVLSISGVTINEWIDDYINSIATTGYSGYYDTGIEERIIYDEAQNNYYKIQHNSVTGTSETPIWAIYDTIAANRWSPGVNNYYYDELDDCGMVTGKKIVVLIDINIFSPRYLTFNYIEKCNYDIFIDTTTGETTTTTSSTTTTGETTTTTSTTTTGETTTTTSSTTTTGETTTTTSTTTTGETTTTTSSTTTTGETTTTTSTTTTGETSTTTSSTTTTTTTTAAPLVIISYMGSITQYDTSADAMAGYGSERGFHSDAIGGPIGVGRTLYIDATLSTPLTGWGGKYLALSINGNGPIFWVQLNNDGLVIATGN